MNFAHREGYFFIDDDDIGDDDDDDRDDHDDHECCHTKKSIIMLHDDDDNVAIIGSPGEDKRNYYLICLTLLFRDMLQEAALSVTARSNYVRILLASYSKMCLACLLILHSSC